MAALVAVPEQMVVLSNATWSDYLRLLEVNQGRNGVRVTFDGARYRSR